MIALLILVTLGVLVRLCAPASFAEIRLRDLARIREALEAYRRDHQAYPAASFVSAWSDGKHNPAWIPGLVPQYLSRLPEDPRGSHESAQQYLYTSDGKDYKIIAHGPEDCALVVARTPSLADPRRTTWAYGYWTAGAATW
ncbi:MAG: hypothetical protein HZA32_18630 [Opitutae bacterium]|nr:hypothetical protein [Opitutae bacterium]